MSAEATVDATGHAGAFEIATERLSTGRRRFEAAPRARRLPGWTGSAATLAIPLLGLVVCVAGTRTESLLPATIQLAPPAALAGPLRFVGFNLTFGEVLVLIAALAGTYLLAVGGAARVPMRTLIWAIVAYNVIVVLGPPLFSTDVFSYQAYARMFAVYHTNPYLHGPNVLQPGVLNGDPLYSYIGSDWIRAPSVYGPLFTLISAAFAWSSVAFSEFGFKLIALASSAGTLSLIWRCARLRGVEPRRALAIFGLSPLVTLSGVGGGHNDLLMLLLVVGGVYAFLIGRRGSSGGLMAAGAAIKLTGGIVLPFALLAPNESGARERRSLILGAAAVSAVIAVASFVVFRFGVFNMLSTLQSVQSSGSKLQSIPFFFLQVAGVRTPLAAKLVVDLAFVVAFAFLLRRVWNGRLDWLEGVGWATLALLVCAGYLLPWYVCWMLPFVALTENRALWRATAVMTLIASAILVVGTY